MSKQELATVSANSLTVPDYLAEMSGHEGGENIGKEDIQLPRLAVCQSLSPQRDKNNILYIEKLNEGNLFNTITKTVYPERVSLIPLLYLKSRVYLKPRKDGGGVLCQSRNAINGGTLSPTCATCEHSQFLENAKPKCDLYMNMVSLLLPPAVDEAQLVLFSFKSMALKTARAWVTLLQARNKPFFTQVYSVRTINTTVPKGSFYTPVVDFERWVSPEELKHAKHEYEALKGKDIATDSEEVVDDDPHEAGDSQIPF